MAKAKKPPVSRRWLVRDFNHRELQWYAESDLFLKADVAVSEDMYEVRQNGQQELYQVAVGEVFLRKVKRAYTFHLAERPSAVFYHPTARRSCRYVGKKSASRCPTDAASSTQPQLVTKKEPEATPGPTAPRQASISDSFQYIRVLGESTFATVWLARKMSSPDEAPGYVAIKVAKTCGISKKGALRDLLQEFEFLLAFQSKASIVQGMQIIAAISPHFEGAIVMEFCDNGSLAHCMSKHYANFNQDQAATWCQAMCGVQCKSALQQIMQGLVALHAAGIVHRDLKPGNILIRSEAFEEHCRCCIADLGAAIDEPGAAEDVSVVTTEWYRAPEIFLGGHATTHADIWAAG